MTHTKKLWSLKPQTDYESQPLYNHSVSVWKYCCCAVKGKREKKSTTEGQWVLWVKAVLLVRRFHPP